MSDAPERIWAWDDGHYVESDPQNQFATEYIRADVHVWFIAKAEAEAERDQALKVLERVKSDHRNFRNKMGGKIRHLNAKAAAAATEMQERIIKRLQDAGIAGDGVGDPLTELLLDLPIDPDTQEALDKLLAKAREDAIREAAGAMNPMLRSTLSRGQAAQTILALLNDGGRNE